MNSESHQKKLNLTNFFGERLTVDLILWKNEDIVAACFSRWETRRAAWEGIVKKMSTDYGVIIG
jgi:hypothetical protein